MSKALVLARSAILAAATPAFAFALALLLFDQYLTKRLFAINLISAFVVSACHILVLGLPAVFALRRAGRLTFNSLAVTGLVVGALPTAALLLVQWATEPSLSLSCQSDPGCQAAMASTKVGAGALLVVIAAGGLRFLSAMSFYASSRKAWLFHRAA